MHFVRAAAPFSVVISLLTLPEARIGVWINAALLVFGYLAARGQWLGGGLP
jgi:hypothetical protein